MSADEVLLLVLAAHLAFQVTVSVVVYPALADAPAERWAAVHAAHSRRILLLVVVLYPTLVVVCAWALLTLELSTGLVLSVGGTALALGTTALAAAPLHGRLGEGWSETSMRRLLLADRVRTLGATVALVGALTAR